LANGFERRDGFKGSGWENRWLVRPARIEPPTCGFEANNDATWLR